MSASMSRGTVVVSNELEFKNDSGSPIPVSGTVSMSGTALVETSPGTPTAIANGAAVAATKYIGVTVAESTGAAPAQLRVRNNNVSGVILDTITLQLGESIAYTYPRGRAAASGTIYIEVVAGAVEGSIFTVA